MGTEKDMIEGVPVKHSLKDSPRRKPDWKGIATLITALAAAAGFAWNKVEGCYDRTHNQAVQSASYEALAGKMEGIYTRVGVLEEVVRMLPSLFTKRQGDAERMVRTLHSAPPEPAPWKPEGAVKEVSASVPGAPEKLFKKSDLPAFKEIQDKAKSE